MTDLERALAGDKNLSRADLSEAYYLSRANLNHANLTGANIAGAIIEVVVYDASTIWPEGKLPPKRA
jgi:uncharacterized protein YjbI with pentapeptide repeats